MIKDLNKVIMNKFKAKNKYLNWPSRENFISYKRTKNKCNSLTKKAKRGFFKEAKKDGIMTSNGCISNDFVGIENDGNLICNKQELVELFNEHYINIVEKSSGKTPLSLGNFSDVSQDEMTVKEIISVYNNHPSIRKIKNFCVPQNKFDLQYASTSDINKTMNSLNVNKTKGPDGISVKFVKMSADVIDCHLANIINNDISLNEYFEHAKTATVRPIFKKDDKIKIKNYRPVSLLNTFWKIYERFLLGNLTNYVDTFLSKFISAYRKSYSSNHVLIRLIEN